MPALFSPAQLGGLTLKNRVICGPLTTNYAEENGEVNARLIAYYARRAAGGAGMVIVEGTFISQEGKGYRKQVGIHHDGLIPGLRELASAIKREGARAAIQIQHCGRRASSKLTGLPVIGPSPIPAYPGADVPQEMDEAKIEEVITQFCAAARRAKEAGFEAVDIHAAHGYLPAAFLSPLANKRMDRWGGSFENRCRFLVEVVRRVKETVGKDFPVTVKISADEYLEGGVTLEETLVVAKLLEACGADGLQISAGAVGGKNVADLSRPHTFMRTLPMGTAPGCLVYLAEAVKKAVSIPVIALGRLSDPSLAKEVVASGKADFVALARPLLADPAWPKKVEEGREEEIRPCIACNEGCYRRILSQEEVTCAVNPEAGQEHLAPCPPASRARKVVVIGGGPAGMEAAIVAASRGHEVTLVEKEAVLGGQLNLAFVPPDRAEIKKLRDFLVRSLEKSKVNVVTGKEPDAALLAALMPEVLVIATGARPAVPAIFAGKEGVFTAWEVLRKDLRFAGKKVLVAGGGLVGCETADYLSRTAAAVTLVEMLPEIAPEAAKEEREFLERKLAAAGAVVLKETKITGFDGKKVRVAQKDGSWEIEVDAVVLALGSRPSLEVAGLALEDKPAEVTLGEKKVPVFYAGDCQQPRKIIDAIREGFAVAKKI